MENLCQSYPDTFQVYQCVTQIVWGEGTILFNTNAGQYFAVFANECSYHVGVPFIKSAPNAQYYIIFTLVIYVLNLNGYVGQISHGSNLTSMQLQDAQYAQLPYVMTCPPQYCPFPQLTYTTPICPLSVCQSNWLDHTLCFIHRNIDIVCDIIFFQTH